EAGDDSGRDRHRRLSRGSNQSWRAAVHARPAIMAHWRPGRMGDSDGALLALAGRQPGLPDRAIPQDARDLLVIESYGRDSPPAAPNGLEPESHGGRPRDIYDL